MPRTPYRDALRLLFAIRAGATPVDPVAMPEIVGVFKGEARLWAFDFWMRYPDYLAAELLDLFVCTKNNEYIAQVESIFTQEEPDLRRVPMIRYFYGAFDRLDDAMSLLRSRDLVRLSGVKSLSKVRETDFALTVKGDKVCTGCVAQEPILQWYADRAALIAKLAGQKGGAALKEQQYKRSPYAATKIGGQIPSISAEVKQQLAKLQLEIL